MTDNPEKPLDLNLDQSIELLAKRGLGTFTSAGMEILRTAYESAAENGGIMSEIDLFVGVLADSQCQQLLISLGVSARTIKKILTEFLPNRPTDQIKVPIIPPRQPNPGEDS